MPACWRRKIPASKWESCRSVLTGIPGRRAGCQPRCLLALLRFALFGLVLVLELARMLGGPWLCGIQNTPGVVGLGVSLRLHVLCVLDREHFTLGLCK